MIDNPNADSLEDRLAKIDAERPPYPGPCQDTGCEWTDVPLPKPMRVGKGVYMTFRRECRRCKRFYGYGREADSTSAAGADVTGLHQQSAPPAIPRRGVKLAPERHNISGSLT